MAKKRQTKIVKPKKRNTVKETPARTKDQLREARKTFLADMVDNAPKQAQLWEMYNVNRGQPRALASAEFLWQEACKYFQWCVDNPLLSHDIKGALNEDVYIKHPRAFTFGGLSTFLGVNPRYFQTWRHQYNPENPSKEQKEYNEIILQIENIIHTQKFEYAIVRIFDPGFTAKDLGMVERHDVKSGDEKLAVPEIKVYNVGPPILNSEEAVKRDIKNKKK